MPAINHHRHHRHVVDNNNNKKHQINHALSNFPISVATPFFSRNTDIYIYIYMGTERKKALKKKKKAKSEKRRKIQHKYSRRGGWGGFTTLHKTAVGRPAVYWSIHEINKHSSSPATDVHHWSHLLLAAGWRFHRIDQVPGMEQDFAGIQVHRVGHAVAPGKTHKTNRTDTLPIKRRQEPATSPPRFIHSH